MSVMLTPWPEKPLKSEANTDAAYIYCAVAVVRRKTVVTIETTTERF